MARYQDLVISRRQRTETVAAMREALRVMDGIMQDPLVTSQRGYAYTDDDVEILEAGRKALERWEPEAKTEVQRHLNEAYLEQGGRAVSLAEMMVRRQGFYEVMSEGSSTLEGDAFNRAQRDVVEQAWEKYQAATHHARN